MRGQKRTPSWKEDTSTQKNLNACIHFGKREVRLGFSLFLGRNVYTAYKVYPRRAIWLLKVSRESQLRIWKSKLNFLARIPAARMRGSEKEIKMKIARGKIACFEYAENGSWYSSSESITDFRPFKVLLLARKKYICWISYLFSFEHWQLPLCWARPGRNKMKRRSQILETFRFDSPINRPFHSSKNGRECKPGRKSH